MRSGRPNRPAVHGVVYPAVPAQADAIRCYSDLLVEALAARGAEARPLTLDEAELHLAPGDVAILQYNPFSWARWGFAPRLALRWSRLRCVRALMIHEPFVPVRDWRSALMGGWQRLQLAALLRSSEPVLLSTEAWRRRLPMRQLRQGVHLPVASNLADGRHRRRDLRDRLGLADETLVAGALSTGHPAQLTSYLEAAVDELAAAGIPLAVLNLGRGARPLRGRRELTVLTPGALPDEDLAAHLAACDLFIAPFVDGVSTRRTSVMAALQHELPVVTTAGPLTDDVFRRRAGEAWVLAPVGDVRRFAAEVRALAASAPARASVGRAGRRAYEELFAWPVVAERVLESVGRCGR